MSLATKIETGLLPAGQSEQAALVEAFSCFTEAAGSLERSYGQLQIEVARLRRELEQAHSELERRREAQRRLEALAEMAALLAHEIRNPLGSLELFAGLLTASQLKPEQARWVRNIQAGLRILSATVNNVLGFYSEPATDLAATDLGELLHWALEFLWPLARQYGVEMEVRNQLKGISVPGDAPRLQQVLLNLALNAFRILPAGGKLWFEGKSAANSPSGTVLISVTDNGCGIEEEKLARIFEPGFTTRSGSAGLGLAVCKKIVEQHRGTITVSSRIGQGTTVTIMLPLPEVRS
jgi:signal transduction histidine kinase